MQVGDENGVDVQAGDRRRRRSACQVADTGRQQGVGQQAQAVEFDPYRGVTNVSEAIHRGDYDGYGEWRNRVNEGRRRATKNSASEIAEFLFATEFTPRTISLGLYNDKCSKPRAYLHRQYTEVSYV